MCRNVKEYNEMYWKVLECRGMKRNVEEFFVMYRNLDKCLGM